MDVGHNYRPRVVLVGFFRLQRGMLRTILAGAAPPRGPLAVGGAIRGHTQEWQRLLSYFVPR